MSSITHGLQHKLMHAAIEKALAPRQFNFTISTEAVDRDKDIIKLSAWNLREYEKNPVVLASHAHQRLPVGRSVSIGVRGESLKATVEFPPKGISADADQVHDLVDLGYLKAASVGFRVEDSEPNGWGGMLIKKATLLEWSICSIGSNPDAMVERSAPAVMRKWLQSKHQQREDAMDTEMWLEIDDGIDTKDDDAFEQMCRQMLAAYSEMDSDKFRELMRVQLATLGPAGKIDDFVRAMCRDGVAAPKYFDIDERQLGRLIAEVISEEAANATKAALNTVLGRLD